MYVIFLFPAHLYLKENLFRDINLFYEKERKRVSGKSGEEELYTTHVQLLENNKYSRLINTRINPIEYYDLQPDVNSWYAFETDTHRLDVRALCIHTLCRHTHIEHVHRI